ncbi:NAD(P)-binding protein [Sistotremastrum niveocremeum HHB9708]|uniref:NAD(P)-binding protein n=1 Tax=Sistotremastrum niveocremeum HHB9708 TaxID=1314777 RepID=A0A164Y6I8_9AGAM|nr:NAD(P)-binding protein [Sistotremastrum niveocremeum HHB9708]
MPPSSRYNGTAEAIIDARERHDVYPSIDVNGALKDAAKGKIVLVTGAGKGVGAETARTYAKAGAKGILITSRTLSDLARVREDILDKAKMDASGQYDAELQVETFAADISDPKQVQALVEFCLQKFGTLDIVISNAGFLSRWTPIAEHDPELWWKTWETNIRGNFNLAHYSLPTLVASKGYFVVVSSIGAQLRWLGGSAYLGGKHALNRFAEYIDFEYGDQGVKSFAFHPGCLLTELGTNTPEVQGFVDAGVMKEDTVALPASVLVRLTSGSEDWLTGRYVSANWDLDDVNKLKEKILKENVLIDKLSLP